MQGKVEICGINTARLEILKNDEMMELLRRTKQGDMAARERLIRGNLRLVLSVIQRFSSRGENADDLFQVGCIGLIKAIDNFDIRQPVRFSTYGVPMIVGEIRRYLRDNSTLRVSRSMRDTAYKVLQARERLLRQQQREPTVEQIAQELELPVRRWCSPWTPCRPRCLCMSRCTPTAGTPCASWIRSGTTTAAMRAGCSSWR